MLFSMMLSAREYCCSHMSFIVNAEGLLLTDYPSRKCSCVMFVYVCAAIWRSLKSDVPLFNTHSVIRCTGRAVSCSTFVLQRLETNLSSL